MRRNKQLPEMSVDKLTALIKNLDAHQRDAGAPEPYLNVRQAAKVVGISHRTLENLRQRGAGPTYYKLGARCVRYKESDLRKWVDSKIVSSKEEARS